MPVTYDQEYLVAILDELRAIHALLASDGPPQSSAFIPSDDAIELRESDDGEAK